MKLDVFVTTAPALASNDPIVCRRNGNTVTVTCVQESSELNDLPGTRCGSFLILRAPDKEWMQKCRCECGHCSGLDYSVSPSVLHRLERHRQSYEKPTECSVGSGTNPDLSPSLEEDAQESKRKNITTMDGRISAWDAGHFPGYLRDPRTYPSWKTTYPWIEQANAEFLPSRQSQYFNTEIPLTPEEIIEIIQFCNDEYARLAYLARYKALESLLQRVGSLEEFFALSEEDQLKILRGTPNAGGNGGRERGKTKVSINEWTEEDELGQARSLNNAWNRGFRPPKDIAEALCARERMKYFNNKHLHNDDQAERLLAEEPTSIKTAIIEAESGMAPFLNDGLSYPEAYAVWWFTSYGKRWGLDLGEPGLGKTRNTLRVMQYAGVSLSVVFSPNINVLPKGKYRTSHWEDEAKKIEYGVTFRTIKGPKSFKNLPITHPLVILINPEQYANPAIKNALGKLPVEMLVFDEAQDWLSENTPTKPTYRVGYMRETLEKQFPAAFRLILSGTVTRGRTVLEAKNLLKYFLGIDVTETGVISALTRLYGLWIRFGWRFECDRSILPEIKDPVISECKSPISCILPDNIRHKLNKMRVEDENEEEDTGFLAAEQLVTPRKLLQLIEDGVVTRDNIRGTIFYTTHVHRVIRKCKDILQKAFPGINVKEYSGQEKSLIDGLMGDPIIASLPLMTGTNGLQRYYWRMIFLTCPWHYPGYFQAISRIWRRCDCPTCKNRERGDHFPSVDVEVVVANVEYDVRRWVRTKLRRSEGELLLRGTISTMLRKDQLTAIVEAELQNVEQVERARNNALAASGKITVSGVAVSPAAEAVGNENARLGHPPNRMGHAHAKMSSSEERTLSKWTDEERTQYLSDLKEANLAHAVEFGESHHDYTVHTYITEPLARDELKPGVAVLNLASSDSVLPSEVAGFGVDLLLPKAVYAARPDILEAGISDPELPKKLHKRFGVDKFGIVMCIGGMFAGGGKNKQYRGLHRSLKLAAGFLDKRAPNAKLVIAYPPKPWSDLIPEILRGLGLQVDEHGQHDGYLYLDAFYLLDK